MTTENIQREKLGFKKITLTIIIVTIITTGILSLVTYLFLVALGGFK